MTQPEIEAVAREMLASKWPEQFVEVRQRILDGSCQIHSDVVSLSCGIALDVIEAALASRQMPTREEVAKAIHDARNDGSAKWVYQSDKSVTSLA